MLGGLGLLSSLGGETGAGLTVESLVSDCGLMFVVAGASTFVLAASMPAPGPTGKPLFAPNCFWRRAMNSSSASAGREGGRAMSLQSGFPLKESIPAGCMRWWLGRIGGGTDQETRR